MYSFFPSSFLGFLFAIIFLVSVIFNLPFLKKKNILFLKKELFLKKKRTFFKNKELVPFYLSSSRNDSDKGLKRGM